jgi:hypothetical protein
MVSGMTAGQRPQDAVWAGKPLLFVFYFTKYKKLTDNSQLAVVYLFYIPNNGY